MSRGEIWVLAERREGRLTQATGRLLGVARALAQQKDLEVAAVLPGGETGHAQELAQAADRVLWLQNPGLEKYEANRSLHALSALLRSRPTPEAVLAATSAFGLELLPRLAAHCGSGYAASCVELFWDGDALVARRPVYGGRVYQEIAFVKKPALLTVRASVAGAGGTQSSPGEVQAIAVDVPETVGLHLVDQRRTSAAGRDISEAVRVVAGGRGTGSAGDFQVLEQLAAALDGSVAASRAVVDAGVRPHDEQVGKSGKTISPELYIACGISGAIHHVLGMNTAKVVVAINQDPGAPIFQNADFGLVGDARQVVPALLEALCSRRSSHQKP